MNLNRRGFLGVLAAAAVGAATFDPKSLLWVPKAPDLVFAPDAFAKAMAPLSDARIQRVIDQQLELNELALRFAQRIREPLARHPAVTLREVAFRQSGQVGLLEIEAAGVGRFVSVPRRLAYAHEYRTAKDYLDQAASQIIDQVYEAGVDVFAPIGIDLRPGEPFTGVEGIGLATDPESGLSVRVLRYAVDRRGGCTQTLTMVELAAGEWHGNGRGRVTRGAPTRWQA